MCILICDIYCVTLTEICYKDGKFQEMESRI